MARIGTDYLVGAGPGDPDLLTLRAARLIEGAQIIVHDGLVDPLILAMASPGAELVSVAKSRARHTLAQDAINALLVREALAGRDKVKKREREFRFPTHITFDNEGSEIYTIIEVDTRDRPGLLYDLTRTLAANNIYIASAVIATFGAQVVDTFYVKDMFGLKLHAKAKREMLEKKLREAIAAGAQRAGQ